MGILHIVVNILQPYYNVPHYNVGFNITRERGGVMVERQTLNREVLGSILTGVTVLCP